MKVPPNMTEEEVLRVMNKVIDKTAAKYTFYGYTVDDIKQESYIICIDALKRYDNKRPLENFLSVNLSILLVWMCLLSSRTSLPLLSRNR